MTFAAVDGDTGEVIEFRGRDIVAPGRRTSVSLEMPETMTFEEWQNLGESLQSVAKGVMWWIGDWLRYGERRWGEMYAQAVDVSGRSYETVRSAKWVAERFDTVRRLTDLSWSHHQEAASLPAADADEVLSIAAAEGWSTRETRAEVNRRKNAQRIGAPMPSAETCTVVDLNKLVELGLTFGTIYADPPWLYDNQMTRAATSNWYGGMTVDQLCEMPVKDLAAKNAHLHLWTTNAFLFDCQRIMDAWGFEFRSTFVWVKGQMGIGNYWRNSHEFMLTGIRGDAKRFNDHSIKSWLECDRGEHSGKPEQVRHYIQRASPGPYLEMFGRWPAEGWTVWGNQIRRSLLFPDVREVA